MGSALFNTAYSYIDDLIVTGNDQTVISNLRDVFARIRRYGLKLSPSKCLFCRKKIKFLGHVVSAQQIEVDPARIQCIRDYPRPTNVKQVRQLCGVFAYNRRFIRNFSNIAAPLYALIKKDAPFQWGGAEERAYEDLKAALSAVSA